jgi:hypothetical protein
MMDGCGFAKTLQAEQRGIVRRMGDFRMMEIFLESIGNAVGVVGLFGRGLLVHVRKSAVQIIKKAKSFGIIRWKIRDRFESTAVMNSSPSQIEISIIFLVLENRQNLDSSLYGKGPWLS